jgi:hypothetical protein
MGTVRLGELKAFTPQTDPNTLVHDNGSYLVPVLLNGKRRLCHHPEKNPCRVQDRKRRVCARWLVL